MASYPDQKTLPAYQEAPTPVQQQPPQNIQQQPQNVQYIQQADGSYVPVGQQTQQIQPYPSQSPLSPPPQVVYVQAPQQTQDSNIYPAQPIQQVPAGQQYSEKGPVQNVQTMPQQQQQQGRQFQNATPLASLGRTQAPADCPACGQRSMTRIAYVVGNYTHAWACISFWITGFCCWVPYLMNGAKNVDHHCGKCGTLLATWHRSGSVEVHQHN